MSRLLWVLFSFVLLTTVGCDDSARCTNYCDNLAMCGLTSSLGCQDRCEAQLADIAAECPEGEDCVCLEETRSFYFCVSLTSCDSLTSGDVVCGDARDDAVLACGADWSPTL